MSRVISLRLDDADDVRLSGAAVLNGKTVSAYIKGLIGSDRVASDTGIAMILDRLDELATTVADVRGAVGEKTAQSAPDLPPRTVIATRLKERGLPSSTIRQVEAVLDELGGKSERAGSPS
jgi:hypothetical protein